MGLSGVNGSVGHPSPPGGNKGDPGEKGLEGPKRAQRHPVPPGPQATPQLENNRALTTRCVLSLILCMKINLFELILLTIIIY